MSYRSSTTDRHIYKTTAWEKTRAAFLSSKHFCCERCGKPAVIVHHKTYITDDNEDNPEITLNWNNLEALCVDCHNKEHFEKDECRALNAGLCFTPDGQIIKMKEA